MDYKILEISIAENIATISLNRPEALNALNQRFFQEMDAALDDLESRKDVGVVIITGSGKAFAAGADIAEMVDMGEKEGRAFSQMGQAVFLKIERFPLPVIAAVNGFALGGGCELAMACDFRIASDKARFGQPEVNLGLTPGYAGTQRLPRMIGAANALYLLVTAELIDAQTALRMGLVQQVVAAETLLTTVTDLAKTILSKGPAAVKLVKQLVRQGMDLEFSAGSDLESDKFSSLFENEGREGMKAFLEKRPPDWQK